MSVDLEHLFFRVGKHLCCNFAQKQISMSTVKYYGFSHQQQHSPAHVSGRELSLLLSKIATYILAYPEK